MKKLTWSQWLFIAIFGSILTYSLYKAVESLSQLPFYGG